MEKPYSRKTSRVIVRSPELLGPVEEEMQPVLDVPWVLSADNKPQAEVWLAIKVNTEPY